MEYNELNKPENKKRDVLNIIFLILLGLAVCGLITCIILFIRYEQMLTNSLGYSLNHFGIDSCTYYSDGAFHIINATK